MSPIRVAACFAMTLIGFNLQAHELITTRLTWTEQVSRIVHKRCVSCHQESGSAPMPLETYAQVRPWATAIKRMVLNREMPPWSAVKGFGSFRNDLSLSQEDIAVLSSWVEGGAPEGDPRYLPAPHQHETAKTTEPPRSGEVMLSGELKLAESVNALSIRPEELSEGGTLQAIAHRPDGSVEHLLWIRDFNPNHRRSYVFRRPLSLPSGTRVILTPAGVTASFEVSRRLTDKD